MTDHPITPAYTDPDEPPPMSPWGSINERRMVAPGIWFCGTATHGGYWISAAMAEAVPESIRRRWFEEDCEWSILPLVFPGAFSKADVELAKQIARDWCPMEASLLLEDGPYRGQDILWEKLGDRSLLDAVADRYPAAYAAWITALHKGWEPQG